MHINPTKISVPDSDEAPIQVADLSIDPATRSVEQAGESIDVRGLSFDLLWELAKASPQPVSRDDLIERVWAQRHVEEHTINQRVSMLRKALGDDGEPHRYIRRMPGEGYALIDGALSETAGHSTPATPGASASRKIWTELGVGLAAVAIGAALWFSQREQPQPTQSDVIAGLDEPITPEMLARVIYDEEKRALRIGSTEAFDTPMTGEFDGVDMFVAGVPDTAELARVPRGLELVCQLRGDPNAGFTRVEPEWRAFLRSADLAQACTQGA